MYQQNGMTFLYISILKRSVVMWHWKEDDLLNHLKFCLFSSFGFYSGQSVPSALLLNLFNSQWGFMGFSVSLSLTVLHTGKRWFIICPVAETPMLDKEKTTSDTSTVHGMLHTWKYWVSVSLPSCLQIYYLLNKNILCEELLSLSGVHCL